ncbi:hypothetical protein BDQ17DRAFT_1425131 [Cyathus striatus]|nr:hypothetical protein BDQ17DRAFT_1425131 [Cyathus striatus]
MHHDTRSQRRTPRLAKRDDTRSMDISKVMDHPHHWKTLSNIQHRSYVLAMSLTSSLPPPPSSPPPSSSPPGSLINRCTPPVPHPPSLSTTTAYEERKAFSGTTSAGRIAGWELIHWRHPPYWLVDLATLQTDIMDASCITLDDADDKESISHHGSLRYQRQGAEDGRSERLLGEYEVLHSKPVLVAYLVDDDDIELRLGGVGRT